MTKTIGKVVEVFIPNQYKKGKLLDVMDRNTIGFKIMTGNGMREIVTEDDTINGEIMKGDLVTIIDQNISGKDFTDIILYEGDNNA